MPSSIHGSFQGTAKVFQQSLQNQPLLILAALLAVYIVLGILYESLIHPITILTTLPSAGVGALLTLMLFGIDFNVISLIGVLLLIGIVKKNAIMMIDFAIAAERDEGLSSRDAILKASLLRFRPILMTTMAALLGALPLAIGLGVELGTAPAPRRRDCGRADLQPGAHALHDAGRVPLFRPLPNLARRARRKPAPASAPPPALFLIR